MKKLFIVLCVVIKMKPCTLFPLFLSICGKPHATAAPGKPITSGSELVGLHQVWGSLPPASLPHGPQPALPLPPGGLSTPRAATAALQKAWAALRSVGQRESQPFAAGPTPATGAGSGRDVVLNAAILGESVWP